MRRISVQLTTDELEAILWVISTFNGEGVNAELYGNLKSARIALIAGTKVAMAKKQIQERK